MTGAPDLRRSGRCGGALGVLGLFLLATAVAPAQHRHLEAVVVGAADCRAVHDGHHPPGADVPAFTAAGERHDHACVGCRLSVQRGLLVAPPPDVGPAVVAVAAVAVSTRSRRVRRPAGGTLRGPPTC